MVLYFGLFCSGQYQFSLSVFHASFKRSCKAGLVVKKSFSICLSEKDFISPSLMKHSLAGYEILGWKLFSLKMFNIHPQSLLACRISSKRSTFSLMDFPLWVTQPFSLAALNIFFSFISVLENLMVYVLGIVFLCEDDLLMECLTGIPWISWTLSCLARLGKFWWIIC